MWGWWDSLPSASNARKISSTFEGSTPFWLCPAFHTIFITLRILQLEPFKTEFVHFVTDKSLMEHVSNSRWSIKELISILILQNTNSVYSLHIRVWKQTKIELKISPGYNHVVLDGPGVKSDQLYSTQNRFRLSSFQCLVLVYISSDKPVRINKYLSFHQVKLKHLKLFVYFVTH